MEELDDSPTYLGCILSGEVAKAHWEDTWGEVPYYFTDRNSWKEEVSEGNTQLGYWESAQAQLEDYL